MNISRHFWPLSILSVLMGFVSQQADARQLNVEEALATAKKESNIPILRNSRATSSFKLVHTEKSESLSTVYVLNKENGGYIVLAADDVAAPVLGYSDTGSFDTADIPENMLSWLNCYSEEIAAAANSGAATYTSTYSANYRAIAPLMTTLWNQDSPYNDLCPLQDGVRCPTGCTATAVSQVMKFHSWPLKGVGTHSYEWSNNGTKETLTFDYGNTHFEWDKMLDTYKNVTSTDEQRNAVATLLYAVGVGADMAYAKSASGAFAKNAARALIENFNYDKAINYLRRQFYTLDEWIDMVYTELSEGRPVQYDGSNRAGGTTSAHAFVVDGYSNDGFFHLNWGWGGTSNGYFRLTALDPSSQGIGGSAGGYNDDQGALFGVQRPTSNSELSAEFYMTGDFVTAQESYTRSGNINFLGASNPGMYYLESIFPFSDITPGVKLVSEDGKNTQYLWWIYKNPVTLNPWSGYPTLEISASSFPTSGTYTVTPVAKIGEKIIDMRVAVGKINKLKLVATPEELTFTNDFEKPSLQLESIETLSGVYVGKKCKISATIKNNGSEYYGNVYPIVYDKSGVKWAQMSQITVNLAEGESTEIEWFENFRPSLAAGDYMLTISDDRGYYLGEGINITVTDPTAEEGVLKITDCVFTSSQGTISSMNNATITSRDISADVTFECTSGLCDFTIYAFVFPLNGGTNVDNAGSQQIFMEKGEKQTLTFKNYMSNVAVNTQYFIEFQGYNPTTGKFIEIRSPQGIVPRYYLYITPSAGVEVIEENDECLLYPNPAETTATVTAGSPINEIAIYSMTGNQVLSQRCDGTNESESIDVSGLSTGNYVVRIATLNGNKIARLIKR